MTTTRQEAGQQGQKRAWIIGEHYAVTRVIRTVEAAKKSTVSAWDAKLRMLNGYLADLEHAADDAGQLELFDVQKATPDDVRAILDNPAGGS